MRNLKGFSLIELMIALGIVSIIVAIAYPSYTASARKTHRADAKVILNDIAVRMQRCFTSNNTFVSSASLTCAVSDQLQTTNGIKATYYAVTVGNTLTATNYKLTAVPITGSAQEKDTDCSKFILEQTGKKTAYDTAGNDTTSRCW